MATLLNVFKLALINALLFIGLFFLKSCSGKNESILYYPMSYGKNLDL